MIKIIFVLIFSQALYSQGITHEITFNKIIAEPGPTSYSSIQTINCNPTIEISISIVDANRDNVIEFNNTNDKKLGQLDVLNIFDRKKRQINTAPIKKIMYVDLYGCKIKFTFNDNLKNGFYEILNENNGTCDLILFKEFPNIEAYSARLKKNVKLNPIIDKTRSKYIVFSFWSPSCKPCIEDLEIQTKYLKSIQDMGVKIINLCDIELLDRSNKLILKYRNLDFYFYNNELMKKLNCYGFPSFLVFDMDKNYIGHCYSHLNELLNLIEKHSCKN